MRFSEPTKVNSKRLAVKIFEKRLKESWKIQMKKIFSVLTVEMKVG